MIEVFKTNVTQKKHAAMLLSQIHKSFTDYIANFDLHDCDRILRVKSNNGTIHHPSLINLIRENGFSAEVLQDVAPALF